jgi:hypothetical protein
MTSSLQSAISEQQWFDANAAHLDDGAIATFCFLLSVAGERRTFTMSLDDMLPLVTCSRTRLEELLAQLRHTGLVALELVGERRDMRWTIRSRPPVFHTIRRPGERFYVPFSRKLNSRMSNLQLAPAKRESKSPSAEHLAYTAAKASCERRGRTFAYVDYESFLQAVGPRPEGTFAGSGRPLYALFRQDDSGHYAWRPKAKGNRR